MLIGCPYCSVSVCPSHFRLLNKLTTVRRLAMNINTTGCHLNRIFYNSLHPVIPCGCRNLQGGATASPLNTGSWNDILLCRIRVLNRLLFWSLLRILIFVLFFRATYTLYLCYCRKHAFYSSGIFSYILQKCSIIIQRFFSLSSFYVQQHGDRAKIVFCFQFYIDNK
jgi:hypothetical protein